jgi:hypothetical protein
MKEVLLLSNEWWSLIAEKKAGEYPALLFPPSRVGDSPSWRRKKLSIYYTDSNGSKVS